MVEEGFTFPVIDVLSQLLSAWKKEMALERFKDLYQFHELLCILTFFLFQTLSIASLYFSVYQKPLLQ